MRFNKFSLYIFILISAVLGSVKVHAQTRTINFDSLARARQAVFDSTRAAQKRIQDSTNTARKRISDSTKLVRERILDSTNRERQRVQDSTRLVRQRAADSIDAIRKYRESKRYTDSVARLRQNRLDSIDAVRTAYADSTRQARQRITDSTTAARKKATDSLKAIQKQRSDSLAAIRKYRESKRYKDSVAIVRTERLDSIKAVRKAYNDSLVAKRKATADSLTASRKAVTDSMTAARTKFNDSVKAVRKVRTDSLAKNKEKREKAKVAREKKKEQQMQLALELKINKKRKAWSNEKMLKKRWGLPRQIIQNTFTRYNYYFNTDRKMDEALDNMQRVRKDNYDSLLALFPFDPDRDSALLAPDMDSIIQKASIGIQIHDPRTKWGDDLYLLMGQAYYYKGDYNNAITAFRYVISMREQNKKKTGSSSGSSKSTKGKAPSLAEADDKKMLDFLKHRSVHNEAILWLARTYTEAHQDGNAESVIELLEADPNMPKNLQGRLALEKAYIDLEQKNYRAATEKLSIVAKDGELPDWVRMRAAFLNGQLLQQQGNYIAASDNYKEVVDLNPKIDMDFYARRNLAYSQMQAGVGQEEAMASLKKVLNDGKYAPYYEQVYYVMGRLAASTNNNQAAIDYLRKSISANKSTRKQKALSFAQLGGVYYNTGDYVQSKQSYDSAAFLGSAAPNDSLIMLASRRSQVLGTVTKPFLLIKEQDSLLALAVMSDKEQRANARRYIKMLLDKKNDSTFLAENAGINAASAKQGDMGDVMDVGGAPAATSWYFANAAQMQQGQNDFKRKWGSRPLTDNWRRMSGSSGSMASGTTGGASGQGDIDELVSDVDENGLPTEESLLAAIPKDAKRQDAARKLIRQGYIDLGNAYVKQLEDYRQAIATLDTLDKRFPDHEYKAESLYLRYLVAVRQNRMNEAQNYSNRLLQEFGDTKWAALVRPKEDGSETAESMANFYDDTYGMMLQRQYDVVLARSREGQSKFADVRYKNRFRIMEAIALAGLGNYSLADSLVQQFTRVNPTDSLRPWADAVIDFIKKNRNNLSASATNVPSAPAPNTPPAAPASESGDKQAPAANAATPVANPVTTPVVPAPKTATNDTAGIPSVPLISIPENAPAAFTYNVQEEHFVVFAFPAMEPRAMGVKAALTDFNTFKFGGLGLNNTVEMMHAKQGLVVVRKFQNAAQAKIYMNALRGTPQVFREYKTNEYNIFSVSSNNYLKILTDKSIQPYMNFYKTKYK